MDYLSILKDTIDYLYKESNASQIWFSGIECISFDGNTLKLRTNTDMSRFLLKGSAGRILKETLKELHDLDVNVVIIDGKPIIDKSRIKSRLSADKIIYAVCEYFDITKETLFDPDAKPASLARRIAMFFLEQCDYSEEEIAQIFSRDKSTIDYEIYSIFCGIRAEDQDIVKIVDAMRIKLEQLSAEELR